MQENLFSIAEAQIILCKGNASRTQENLFSIAEAQIILCKGKTFFLHPSCKQYQKALKMPVPDDGNGLLQLNLPATFYLNIISLAVFPRAKSASALRPRS